MIAAGKLTTKSILICWWGRKPRDFLFIAGSISLHLFHMGTYVCSAMRPGFAPRCIPRVSETISGSCLWLFFFFFFYQSTIYILWNDIKPQQCVLRQRSKRTCLWVVSCEQQTLRLGLHYRRQCPLCVRNSQPLKKRSNSVGLFCTLTHRCIVTEWLPCSEVVLFLVFSIFRMKRVSLDCPTN